MNGLAKRYKLTPKKRISKNEAQVHCFELKKEDINPLERLRNARDGVSFMNLEPGVYVRLLISGTVFMSDTPMEKRTNEDFIQRANGRVLIGGLGLGLLIENLLPKIKTGEVSEVVVVEHNQDVIDLVAPFFKHRKKIVKGDIFTYQPEGIFDTIYFDIWQSISTDNLDEMTKLHRKYRRSLNKANPSCDISSWMRWYLQREKRRYG